jgi:hypothetical protein
MAAYFLDHVRNRYKLATNTLDERFIQLLKIKSGESEENIRSIVSFVKYIDDADVVDDDEIATFHKNLEAFYQHT